MKQIEMVIKLSIITILFSSSLVFGQTQPSTPKESSGLTSDEAIAKMERFLEILDAKYMDDVDEGKLVEDAINAVLEKLDPHSVYFTEEELVEANQPLEGNFEGVGIQFNILKDTIIVVNTISGGPSEKVGVMSGDKIVIIDGENVASIGITTTGVTDRLRGKKGTEVNVAIVRKGIKKNLEFKITRDVIPLYSVDASYMSDPETGYIRVSKFAATTTEEFQAAIAELQKEGMKNLILDLRGNGGGYMNAAIDMADEFLDAGKLIVYQEGKAYPRQDAYSTSLGMIHEGKVIVLIDEGSASASEIVTGALQDWDRALVIGRRSFGKGLVQRPFNLPDGSAMRLTVSRYFTPSGRSIQKSYEEGVEKYHDDITNRYKDGELFADSMYHYPDSLKYYTKNSNRLVYGGGGIMPDIFIPLDTTWVSDYYSEVVGKGIVNQFALTYVNENRETLNKKYTGQTDFAKGFNVDGAIWKDFFAYAENDSIKYSEEQFKQCEEKLSVLLESSIARNLYGFEAFWYVYNIADEAYIKALEALHDNTFKKMKIAAQ
ncbi:MAG: S41 family peptidase [Fimbriimonadaceae bacterium]|nr:S41 family peptidase [Chitinophagales bacterium]